ncbi:MAG: glycosyltransferase family 39 protein [Chroococcidiopsidaceae cyanobacterium CP_BM_ER_R8_30]|nr:glycosyltransferase family 39 protein [Chroococcidiopsidaceae cyanobacterium CP_BM_ER_R8_30]
MKRSKLWLPLGLVLTLGLLLGMLGFSVWEKTSTPVDRVAWSQQAQWIAPQTPTYRFYARHTFYLPDNAKAGWLRLSADHNFIVYINGQQVAIDTSAFNNSSGLGTKRSLPFQGFNDSNPYLRKTHIAYLLASARDWKLTTYINLTSFLRPGKNVIGLELQKGQTNPRAVAEGFVYPVADPAPINLTTGATSWRISNLWESRESVPWFDPNFPDESWSEAKVLGPVTEATYSRLSQNLFDRSLQGSWIGGTQSYKGEVWLRGVWQIPSNRISRAYIRFAGNSNYSLLLNGALVNHYKLEDSSKLHLLEVTKLLHPGNNILAVSLASPLNPELAKSNYGSMKFLLDGWGETEKGEIVGAIATDNTWTSLTQTVPGWAEGVGEDQPATFLGLPQAQQFKNSFEGNAYLLNYPNYLWHQSLWQLGGIALALIYVPILGLWLGHRESWRDVLNIGAATLLPGTLFLIAIGLLKHRYAEAETGLLFAQPQSNYLILLGFIGVVVLTLLFTLLKQNMRKFPRCFLWSILGLVAWASMSLAFGGNNFFILVLAVLTGIVASISLQIQARKPKQILLSQDALQKQWSSWGERVFLVIIISIGFGLRIYHLGFMALDADENTSLDATRGILRTGIPIAASGIWYTRGPFYHYLLAIWLRLVGDSIVNARFLSALVGTATLIVVYIIACQLTKKVWIALFITAVLAINPEQLWYSRYIRFYPVLQLFTILSFWSFLKGFIDKTGKCYQYIFFIALTLSLLTQEINLTLLPVFLIGFLYFYRPFSLLKDWQIILGSMMTLAIFICNLCFALIKLLTPLPALSDATASYLRLHFSDMTDLFNIFFVGPDRMHTIYSLLFFAGFIYFIKRKDGKYIFLFFSIFFNILIVTCLTYTLAERYVYGVYPLFIMLSVYSGICIMESLGKRMQWILDNLLPLKLIALSCLLLLLVGNIQPERILPSYQEAILRRHSDIFEYIRIHKQSGDIVVSSVPVAAIPSLGKLDYYLFANLGTENFDSLYWHDNRLIDRWAGGVVINSVDQMNRILKQPHRVWIHIDDVRQPKVEHLLAQYVQFLGKPVFETFGGRLRLWQPEDGFPTLISNEGKDLGAY